MISDSAASKLRAKIRAMSPEELQSEDGQLDQQRLKEHEAAREKWAAENGKALRATKLKLRVQGALRRIAVDTSAIKKTGEQTKANTDELLQRAQGKLPEKRPEQSAAERKRELDLTLANIPTWRAERKEMAALERQEARSAKAVRKNAVAPSCPPNLDRCFRKDYVPADLREQIWNYIQNETRPYHVSLRKGPVKTRPKANFSVTRREGAYKIFSCYRWGHMERIGRSLKSLRPASLS